MIHEHATVIKNESIAPNVFDLSIQTSAKDCKPGQFLNLYPVDGATILPRPISICDFNDGVLRLVYRVVGKGTAYFSSLKKGDKIRILAPLGNGFSIPQEQGVHVVVGGGIGTPPLLYLAKQLKGQVHVMLGFRSDPILVDEFKKITPNVTVATRDGLSDFNGGIIELFKHQNINADYYYSCGPVPMLKTLGTLINEQGRYAQLSLESNMACGIGACVGCTVKVQKLGENDWEYLKTCKDGPVFSSKEVVLE